MHPIQCALNNGEFTATVHYTFMRIAILWVMDCYPYLVLVPDIGSHIARPGLPMQLISLVALTIVSLVIVHQCYPFRFLDMCL